MWNRSNFFVLATLIAWAPFSYAKKAPTPLLISAQELGNLPEDKRALYLVEFLKFMQHLEEFQKKYGMDYASYYFDLLLPTADAQAQQKCFYGMHIRKSVRGYCFHDKQSGDRDLTQNVDCKEPVRVINRQTKQYQSYKAVMECPRLLFEKSDGGVYCTKLGDGSSEGCINHLRGDNPNAPLEQSEKFKALVKKFAACKDTSSAPSYCGEWNQYQKDFDSICPGVTRGVRMLCGEITPFLSTLRTQVGLAAAPKPEPPPEPVKPPEPKKVEDEKPKEEPKKEEPKPPTSLPIPPRPPVEPPKPPEEPAKPAPAPAKTTPPPVMKPSAPPVEPKAAPVPKTREEMPKPVVPPPSPGQIKPAGALKAGEHSCAKRTGGYPKYANNFACLMCPIEAMYESENPDYKVSDRYLSMLSVLQGLPCQGAGGAQRPLPQPTLELVNKWGYCSADVYKWSAEPSTMVKTWNTSARAVNPGYRSLFTSKGKRMRAMKDGQPDSEPLTEQEKAFRDAYGIDFFSVSQMYCAKDEAEFNQILTRAQNVDAGLMKCLKETADKRRKISASKGCYSFSHKVEVEGDKLSSIQIDNLMKQKHILRFEYNCGTQVPAADQDKCEVLEMGKDKDSGAAIVNSLRPSQINSAGGYLVGQAQSVTEVRSHMEGKAKACMYQYADYSQKNCAVAKVPSITGRALAPVPVVTPATPTKQ